jgi:membrane-associated phospholipid phosphatase
VEGTHYLSDMLAGALVGIAALAGSATIGRYRRRLTLIEATS